MNHLKKNSTLWYSLGLVLLLFAAFAVISTGPAFARYRTEIGKNVTFEVREPEQIVLGTVEKDLDGSQKFISSVKPVWETEDGVTSLTMAVANGTNENRFAKADQKIKIRMIGSLGLWSEDSETADVILSAEGLENSVKATVSLIAMDTAVYHTNGEGWVFGFYDENGEELSWILEGGEHSFAVLEITVEASAISNPSLLQPQIVAEIITE